MTLWSDELMHILNPKSVFSTIDEVEEPIFILLVLI